MQENGALLVVQNKARRWLKRRMRGTYNSDSDDIATSTFAEKCYIAHTLNENDLKVSLKGYNV
jgi:hypothetical protein